MSAEPGSPQAPEHRRAVLVLLAAVAVGAWPHLFALSLWPTTRDDVLWLARSAPTHPGWARWVFAEAHFVGYRPVTALSFAADALVGGFSALPYRVTDLALHLGCALALAALGWRASPRGSVWGPVVGAALFLAHPLTSEVVPHLARRAYSLATLLSLAGLWVGHPAEGEGRRRRLDAAARADPPEPTSAAADRDVNRVSVARSLAGAGLLGAGALAHEAGYLAFPIAALLAHRSGASSRATALRLVPAGLVLVGLLAVRLAVVPGGIGGYSTEAEGRTGSIARSHWEALTGAASAGAELPGPPVYAGLLALVGAAYLVGRALVGLRSGRSDLGWILVVWLLAQTLVFSLAGVWFPRQAYLALAPWALWVGTTLADTRGQATSPRGLALHLLPQLGLVAVMLARSPVFWGTDAAKVAAWRRTDAATRAADAALRGIPRRARVYLVFPHYLRPAPDALRARERAGRAPFGANHAALWLSELHRARVELAVLWIEDPSAEGAPPVVTPLPQGVQLDLPPGTEVYLTDPVATEVRGGGGQTVKIEPRGGRDAWVYVYDGGTGQLLRIEGSR